MELDGLRMIPVIALMICVAGIVVAAGAMSVSKFKDTTDLCYNSSYKDAGAGRACTNKTAAAFGVVGGYGTNGLNLSVQGETLVNTLDAEGDIGENLGTVSVIGIMTIVIGLLASLFVYFKFF